MSDTTTPPCGCCAGTTRETPAPISNRPGLPQIAYRVGTQTSFKASMLAALSDPAFPALAPLSTRDDGDFTIALLDAFAVCGDIITFYQERLANEAYLGTAVAQRSVFELARLVGYQPSPGVAASAPLAFTLNDAPGAPDPVTIPAATRVQSVPGPGQSPVTFETTVPLLARIAHNALPAATTVPVDWTRITTSLWLAGTATGLKPGDAILLVDADRAANVASTLWEMRTVTAVAPDAANGRTQITWDEPLFDSFRNAGPVGARNVQLYALRKRASLFGVTAPDPTLFATNPAGTGASDWTFKHDTAHVDLDTVYPDLAPVGGSADFATAPERFAWLVLSRAGSRLSRRRRAAGQHPPPIRRLYRILAAADRAPLRYTLSAKATGLTLDADAGVADFVTVTRAVTAFVQSEPLAIAEQPIIGALDGFALGPGALTPVAGSGMTVLGGGQLAGDQRLGVSGKRARLQFGADPAATLIGPDGRTAIALAGGDQFLIDAYPPVAAAAGALAWSVLTTKGVAATLTAQPGAITLLPAVQADPVATEAATLASNPAVHADRADLTFTAALTRAYDRATTRLNANVVDANQGETVQEILGGGDSSQVNQSFTLKQGPLTYVSAAQGQGAQSTLQVWVNDLRWQEQPGLLDAGPRDRVFVTRRSDTGTVTVQFGDGQHGGRPPTGQTNIRAIYRKGLGTAGNVAVGQLSQAIDRPAGLSGVANPAPGSGGADPDTPASARASAPLHVRTLERVVSLQDYEDFALAFAGIARALATWTWFGRTRGVVVTVAGPGGSVLDPQGDTIGNLAQALRGAGNPYVPIVVLPHRPAQFAVTALVQIDDVDYDPDAVLQSAQSALLAGFGFDARTLGEGVTQSAIVAALQAVPGVVGLRLTRFTRDDVASVLPDFLTAAAPVTGERGAVQGAELLLIDPVASLVDRWT
ncbi:MAG TPA: putative baseplate assembly protein [Acetobacteraceae bacterium]|nr:putative baseplate assembly protein [Acetobacteraceae bacterium]